MNLHCSVSRTQANPHGVISMLTVNTHLYTAGLPDPVTSSTFSCSRGPNILVTLQTREHIVSSNICHAFSWVKVHRRLPVMDVLDELD